MIPAVWRSRAYPIRSSLPAKLWTCPVGCPWMDLGVNTFPPASLRSEHPSGGRGGLETRPRCREVNASVKTAELLMTTERYAHIIARGTVNMYRELIPSRALPALRYRRAPSGGLPVYRSHAVVIFEQLQPLAIAFVVPHSTDTTRHLHAACQALPRSRRGSSGRRERWRMILLAAVVAVVVYLIARSWGRVTWRGPPPGVVRSRARVPPRRLPLVRRPRRSARPPLIARSRAPRETDSRRRSRRSH
jgi:hypothetical protein